MARRNSGVVGTFYDNGKSKWVAGIKVKYKKIFCGAFDTLKEAAIARYRAEQKFNRVKKDHLFGAYQWLRKKRLLDENENVIEKMREELGPGEDSGFNGVL